VTIALDSNVFLAYLAQDEEFYTAARDIMQLLVESDTQAVCSSIVFSEIVYVTKEPESLLVVDAFFAKLTNCSDKPADKIICQKAAQLRQAYPPLKLPDALHLATALIARANKFITADKRLLLIAQREMTSIYLKDFHIND